MRLRLAFPPRYTLIALGSALLAFEGYNFSGFGLSVSGWGAARMALDAALGLALLLVACLPSGALARWRWFVLLKRTYWRLRALAVIGLLALVTLSSLALLGVAYEALILPPSQAYVTDTLAFTDENARLTLSGKNPYDPATSDRAFVQALQRFPHVVPTPLRRGALAHQQGYPSHALVDALKRRYLRWETARVVGHTTSPDPTGGAFDPQTTHSYPALSFLLYAPLLWAGAPGVLPFSLAVYLALLVWLTSRAPVGMRFWAGITALAALPLTLLSLLADVEVVCLGFLLVAWRLRDSPRYGWLSGVFLGLGCAFRQYCWLFAPFYLLDALLTSGWRVALKRAGITLAAFLASNLPYLITSPRAWFTSLWLPLSEPLFAHGVGLVALFPSAPPFVFGVSEALAMVGALTAYVRWHITLRQAGLLLALLPLFFAFRSLPNYFAIAPWLALYAVNVLDTITDSSKQAAPNRYFV